MRKIHNLLILSLLAFVVVFSSCTKSSGDFNMVPENAKLVVVFDGKNLSEKTGFSSFSESNTFTFLQENMDESEMATFKMMEPIMKNTEESGINLKSDYYMFSYKKETNSLMGMVINVLDKTKLETTINNIAKADEAEVEIKTDGSFSYLYDEALVIWDDARLLVLGPMDGGADEATLLTEAKILWAQESAKSISSNKDFADFTGNRKDISVWMDYAIFFDNLPPMQRMMMQSNMPFDMSGTLVHAYADFQKGKAIMSYDVVMNEEMASFMADNQVIKDDFDTEILEVMPEKTYANFSMAMDFLAYFEVLKSTLEQSQMDMDQVNEQMKAQIGMTLTEALNEFSGEVVMNIHGIDFIEKEKTDYDAYYESDGSLPLSEFKKMVKEPVIHYSVAAAMNNDKLFNVLVQNMGPMLQNEGDFYSMSMGNTSAYFGLFGKKLVFTNDKDLIAQVVDGEYDGETLADSDLASNLKDFPAYGFVDLDFDSYPADVQQAMKDQMGEKDFGIFKSMISMMKSIELKPKSSSEAEMIIHMKDDSKNSLEVMLRTMDDNIQAIAD
jgi:hypothetical protein